MSCVICTYSFLKSATIYYTSFVLHITLAAAMLGHRHLAIEKECERMLFEKYDKVGLLGTLEVLGLVGLLGFVRSLEGVRANEK